MTPEQEATVAALMQAQGAARSKVNANLLAWIRQAIAAMAGQWYDDGAIASFKSQVTEMVSNGQQVVGDSTGAFVDQVLDELGVTPAKGAVSLPDRLRDVDPNVEWDRPASEYRRLRVLGADDVQAQERAASRAEALAQMDLDLAMREAARQRIAPVPNVRGYRRVIRPELSESGTCGLCIAASDRVYHVKDLLPIHARCKCEVMPITKANDPGLRLNSEDLKALYGAAGDSTSAAKLKRVRATVEQNGELGPVLRVKGQNFRDKGDVKADKGHTMTDRELAAGRLRVSEGVITSLEERAAKGEDVSVPLAYQRTQVAKLRKLLAA